jgi:hypothetical protein
MSVPDVKERHFSKHLDSKLGSLSHDAAKNTHQVHRDVSDVILCVCVDFYALNILTYMQAASKCNVLKS